MSEIEITGLDIPKVVKELETILKEFPASRIEIQLKGTQYIKVHFDEVTTIHETGEKTVKARSYKLTNGENGNHLHEWNASPVGTAILQAIENQLTLIVG